MFNVASISLIAFEIFSLSCIISASSNVTTDSAFLADCIYQHNHYRKLHGVPVMMYDEKALDLARAKALQMSKSISDVGSESNYTLNWSWDSGRTAPNCKASVARWYKGVHYYNFGTASVLGRSEPFARLIWKRTVKIGCARVVSDDPWAEGTFTVCVYTPKGDFKKKANENIMPISHPPGYYSYYLH